MRRSDVIYTIEQCRQSCEATNYMQLMMILAMAMGHTVGRSAMGMGEGDTLWSGRNPPSVGLREIETLFVPIYLATEKDVSSDRRY